MRRSGSIAVCVAVLVVGAAGVTGRAEPPSSKPGSDSKGPAKPRPEAPERDGGGRPEADKGVKNVDSVLDFTMNSIDGEPVHLSKFKGKVVLIVNTASKCGFTPQYKALESLYKQKKDEGFVVLGFPANNFAHQEPGTDAEIKAFCTSRFDVTFPMFAKISVKGKDQHEMYKWLVSRDAPIGGKIKWNFTKFLVDRNGRVVARFGPATKPDSKKVVRRIDELLAEKAEAGKAGHGGRGSGEGSQGPEKKPEKKKDDGKGEP